MSQKLRAFRNGCHDDVFRLSQYVRAGPQIERKEMNDERKWIKAALKFGGSDEAWAEFGTMERDLSAARARIAELENRNNRALEIEDNLKDQLAQLQVERDSWLRAKNLLEAEWTNEKKHDSGLDEVINLQKQLAEAQKEIRAQRVLIALGESAEREVDELQAQLRASMQTCGCGDIRPASEFCHLCGKCQMGCCFCVSEKEHAESKARIAELEKDIL